jgi:hypothetical protein
VVPSCVTAANSTERAVDWRAPLHA